MLVHFKMTTATCFRLVNIAVPVSVVIFLAYMLRHSEGAGAEYSGPGTDPGLEAIFKGRCAEYLTGRVNSYVQPRELGTKNCTLLWELFYNAFVYRDPCNVTMDRYTEFVQRAAVGVPADRAVYWDAFDVYSVARSYTDEGNRANTLEFMLVGYIMNGLVFCGQTEDPGVRYESCPGSNECGFAKGSMDAFWGAASKYFGMYGKGKVKFIFNSNRPGGAFQVTNSYFAEFELANMDSSNVTRVDIYIVTFIGEEQGDTCESKSIRKLKDMLTEKGIEYKCLDQPNDVLHVMCADQPGASECTFASCTSRADSHLISISAAFLLHVAYTQI